MRRGARAVLPRRPRARWRPVVFYVSAAGAFVSMAAFAFCVIASVAYSWHRAVTKPGIAVSVIVLVACIAVVRLTGDDR